jgi:type IV pilus assembly protein PilM
MEILPKNLGTRPRLAVEIRPEGIVAARADDAAAILNAVAERSLPHGAFAPGLKSGAFVNQAKVAAALRETLDAAAARGERTRYVTLVVPDSSTRVLLLEFDELPTKAVEALPIVRFRLKKLVPFDADHAMVSYQVMSSQNGIVRVLAVAMPTDVLAEYENAITAAGYITGAVLPSTLAALAAVEEQEDPVLLVNASHSCVTTAIVRGSTLLLHRALDLAIDTPDPIAIPALHGTVELDQIEAEARMESQILQAVVHERTNESEITQAVSVAAAYFEDTLSQAPELAISAGTIGAEGLHSLLEENGMTDIKVREAVGVDALAAGVASRGSRGWLAGIRGALRN